ncbi:MAG TPA: plastocyanin/azurin family copper-binding protein [Chloroflexota bacterium]|nr:plastocyanin/azurin family copper-binding protein [Chloroflexota bacterium]
MLRLLFLTGLALAVTACGTPSHDSGPHVSAFAMTHPQIVEHPGGHPDALYEPNPIRVRVGQVVAWVNKDHEAHTVTADDGSFDSGPIAYGSTWRWVFARPGTYAYFCTLHPGMHGVIIVTK